MSSDRRGPLRGLYVISPQTTDTARLAAMVEDCLAGGATLVQYRGKGAAPDLALEQSRRLVAVCRAHHAALIVNDSVELALAANADGVHLGRDDGCVASARAALPGKIIGASCYNDPRLARIARAAGADYVAIGSMFASDTKPHAVRASFDDLAAAKSVSGLPAAAIGGITLANASGVIAAGADMVAVLSAVFDAADVHAAAHAFTRLFESPVTASAHVRTQPRAV